MTRRELRDFLLLLALAAAWRLAGGPGTYLELDGAVYERAAYDHMRHLHDGTWLTAPRVNEQFAGIEYWPPLYPLLSGLLATAFDLGPDAAARGLSTLAGILLVLPVYAIGRRFYGHGAGLWAAGLTAVSPTLSWLGGVPRSEPLYIVLLWTAAALLLRPPDDAGGRPLAPLLGGVAMGLAYLTRFDGVAAAAFVGLTSLLMAGRRGLVPLALFALGFVAAALPYWGFLASLNGGVPVLATPQKIASDALEAVWSVRRSGTLADFVGRFGVVGIDRVDPSDLESLTLTTPGWWISNGVRGLPAGLREGARNLSWLVCGLAGWALLRDRSRRTWGLLVLLLPAVGIALGSFWDPHPRYHAFTIPVTTLLAGRMLEALRTGEATLSAAALAFGVPALAAADLYLPRGLHFDIPFTLEPTFAPPSGGGAIAWLPVEAAILGGGLATLAARVPLQRAAAACGLGLPAAVLVRQALQFAAAPLVSALGAAAVGLLGAWYALSARRAAVACAVLLIGIAALDRISMRRMDRVYAEATLSQEVADHLLAHPEYRTVMARNGFDALRSGHAWIGLSEAEVQGGGVDVVVVRWPMADSPLARQLSRGGVPLRLQVPSGDGEWRLYDLRNR